jgi:hypothetical protein
VGGGHEESSPAVAFYEAGSPFAARNFAPEVVCRHQSPGEIGVGLGAHPHYYSHQVLQFQATFEVVTSSLTHDTPDRTLLETIRLVALLVHPVSCHSST